MNWSHDALWSKALVCIEQAFRIESRDSAHFPLWATIALEFIGRATLAKIHPSLLADPQTGDNVMYACGVGDVGKPRSVPAKTIFDRCRSIIEGFTKAEFGFCMSLVDKRNEQLHSGGAPFEDFPTHLWLADYYRVVKILTEFQGFTLDDLFEDDDAKAAETMVVAAEKTLMKDVKKRISAHTTIYGSLDAATKGERQEETRHARYASRSPTRTSPCPACGEECRITGEEIRSTEHQLVEDELTWETIVLPTALQCHVCGLELRGHDALHIAELGGQFTVRHSMDARDFYLADFDPAEYYGEEYMNS